MLLVALRGLTWSETRAGSRNLARLDGVRRDPENRSPGSCDRWHETPLTGAASARQLDRRRRGRCRRTIHRPYHTVAGLHRGRWTRLFVVEDLPAWPLRRFALSKHSPDTVETRHFVDPSLAVAALRPSPARLLGDVQRCLGLLFESLVVRDLRIYAQAARRAGSSTTAINWPRSGRRRAPATVAGRRSRSSSGQEEVETRRLSTCCESSRTESTPSHAAGQLALVVITALDRLCPPRRRPRHPDRVARSMTDRTPNTRSPTTRIRTLDRGTKTGHAYVCSVTNRAVEPSSGSLSDARARQIAPTNAPRPHCLRSSRCAARRQQQAFTGRTLPCEGVDPVT